MFGWVLWLIQQRHQTRVAFRDVMRQVVARVDKLTDTKAGRLESLLWFIKSLVYHDREPPEHEPLVDIIRSTVRKANQPMVDAMSKSIAQAIKEEGKIEGRREYFLLLLQERFKTVPESIVAEIEGTTDLHQFDVWVNAFKKASTIADIPFKSHP
jgi:hypothetical protein